MPLLFLLACGTESVVTLPSNEAPEINITSHSDDSVLIESDLQFFRAQITDKDNRVDELLVAWFMDDQLVCDYSNPDPTSKSYCEITPTYNTSRVVAEVVDLYGESDSDEVSVFIIPNSPPEATITSPVQGGRYYTSNPILFAADVEDEEDPSYELSVTWNSSLDGELNLSSSANDGILSEYTYLSQGQHTIAFQLMDSGGQTYTQNILIDVLGNNQEPSCDITSPLEGVMLTAGLPITFQGFTQDTESDPETLQNTWISSLDGELGSGSIDSYGQISFSSHTLSEGEHQITLRVEDDGGAVCQSLRSIKVNAAPEINILTPQPYDIALTGEYYTFSAEVVDVLSLSEEIQLEWYSDVDGLLQTGMPNPQGIHSFNMGNLSQGPHLISLYATDAMGLQSSAEVYFRINTPPEITSALFPFGAFSQTELIVAPTIFDPDGDTTFAKYEWYQNGTLTSYISDRIPGTELHIGDVWTLRATPNDGYSDGNTLEESVTVGNAPPTITSVNITPLGAIYNDQTATCTGIVYDPDETLTPTYNWIADSQISGQFVNLASIGAEPGDELICIVSVTDSNGSYAEGYNSFTVANRDPVIADLEMTPSPAYANSTLHCEGSYSDQDSTNITASYEWTINGSVVATADSLDLTPFATAAGDQVSCALTVTDSNGGTDSSTVTSTLINGAPTIDEIVFSPTNITKEDTLICSASIQDPDGDPVTVDFEFEHIQSGTVHSPTSTSSQLATLDLSQLNVQTSDGILCTITAVDSTGLSTTDSAIAQIVDAPPVFTTSASISPSSPTTGTTVTCAAAAFDSNDGSILPSYTWENNGTIITTGNTYTISATDINVGDTLTCRATATDSSGSASESLADETISNTIPMIQDLVITPYTALYNDATATCSATVVDPDESLTATFTWKLNGSTVGTSDSLSLDLTSAMPTDTLTCSASAYDSQGASDTDSISFPISNRIPTAPLISLSPSSPVIGADDIVCNIDAQSQDADGQSITYSYAWMKNNVLTTETSNTISTSLLEPNDIWTCEVTPNDGVDEGQSSTASVAVASPCYFGDCDNWSDLATCGMDWVNISSGLFSMGSSSTEIGRLNREDEHTVILSQSFEMMTTEVTQNMFEDIMGYNPSFFGATPADTQSGGLTICGSDCPVEYVTWHEAAAFANELTNYINNSTGTTYQRCYSCVGSGSSISCSVSSSPYLCDGYRLPTEAEWEKAARDGSASAITTNGGGVNFTSGPDPDGTNWYETCSYSITLSDNITELDELGHYCYTNTGSNGDSDYGTSPVAELQPNSVGLFDIYGNVREWTNDHYATNLGTTLLFDPFNEDYNQGYRTTRGGYWADPPNSLRSAARSSYLETGSLNGIGFRLVRTTP